MTTLVPPTEPSGVQTVEPRAGSRPAGRGIVPVLLTAGLLVAAAVVLRRWWEDGQTMLVTDSAPGWSAALAAAGAVAAGGLVLRAVGDRTGARRLDTLVTWSAVVWTLGTAAWMLATLAALTVTPVWRLAEVDNLTDVAAASRLVSAQVLAVWAGLVVAVAGRALRSRGESLGLAALTLAGLVAVAPSPILRTHEAGFGHSVVLAAAGLEVAAVALTLGGLVAGAVLAAGPRSRGLASVPGLDTLLTAGPLVVALAIVTARVVREDLTLGGSVAGQLVILQVVVVVVLTVIAHRHRQRPQLRRVSGPLGLASAVATEVVLAAVVVAVAWLGPTSF